MSSQNPGNFITKNNVAPTSSFSATPAPGVWSLDEALQYRQAGVWPSYVVNAIEDVFSTYLFTGNGSTQTITNNIDLLTSKGIVWAKSRSNATAHYLTYYDGSGYSRLNTASTNASGGSDVSFLSNGFSTLSNTSINVNNYTYASWSFKKQQKFFDVVTYTGDGSSTRDVSHSLNSVPGCIIIKRTDSLSDWYVYHQAWGFPAEGGRLNGTEGFSNTYAALENVTPTSTTFRPSQNNANINGGTYVAYLFAHNAGGFGAAGTDNVITCGSYTTTGGGTNTINLGWEPQFLLVKRASNITGDVDRDAWHITDNMRGMTAYKSASTQAQELRTNANNAETGLGDLVLTSTGFIAGPGNWNGATAATYIYIAIRRGPMRAPTSGTSVFSPNLETTTGSAQTITTNFPVDLTISANRTKTGDANTKVADRLRGSSQSSQANLNTNATSAENTPGFGYGYDNNTGYVDNMWANLVLSGNTVVLWNFRRAPGFFDVVCFAGQNGPWSFNHNLNAIPELVIIKARNSATYPWSVWTSAVTLTNAQALYLNTTAAIANSAGGTPWNGNPTSSVFNLGTDAYAGSTTGINYVAYLFATVAGVSKVGSYTGTGALQTINCGFASGARFVLIKRTDSTGDWYVYDSARGITSGNDPYLFLNSTAAEVTTTNYVDTTSVGFQVTAAAPAGLNASGGTYIFLAIA